MASKSSSSVKSLSRKLSSLSKTASSVASTGKAQGKDTTGITNAINKSNAMVSQTNRQGSKSFSGSKEEKAYTANVITPSKLESIAPAVIPTPMQTKAPDMSAGNVAITGADSGISNTNGMLTVDPITQQAMDSGESRITKLLNDMNAANESRTSSADVQRKVERDSGIKQYRQQVNDLSSQINNITATRDAEMVGLEGQGRGITESIIGGQQAQINREAYIKAAPLQALLANAQGNLDTAKEYINTWGQILMQDANTQYNNKVKAIEAVYNFGTAQDKLKFDSLQTQAKEKKDASIALATAKTNMIKQAMGQNAPASVIQAIQAATDEMGVVSAGGKYNGDVLAQQIKQKQLDDLYAPKVSAPAKRDTQVVDGKLVDMQTGEVISEFGAKAQQVTEQSKQSITDVDALLKNKTGMSTSVGTNFLSRSTTGFWGNVGKVASLVGIIPTIKQSYSRLTGQEQSFIGGVEQMRQQLTLDNLVRAKQNGATFGALSDGERQMLASSASKIGTWAIKDKEGNVTGYNIDQRSFTKEVQAINNFAKIDYLNRGGDPADIGAVANPDGSVWVKNADGTFSQLK